MNSWIVDIDKFYDNLPPSEQDSSYHPKWRWKTCLVNGAGSVPVFLDNAWYHSFGIPHDPPPREDWATYKPGAFWPWCMNRHNGGTNGLFMDWSVRKVGLKELWTLKWHREWDTANEWTKAGSVKPGDWPQWLRRFRDY